MNDSRPIRYVLIPHSDRPTETLSFLPLRHGDALSTHLGLETVPLLRLDSSRCRDGIFAYRGASTEKNVRATRLAMAMGKFGVLLCGDVYVGRLGCREEEEGLVTRNVDLVREEVEARFVDLRSSVWEVVAPRWMAEAERNNYEDRASLLTLASVMGVDNTHEKENSTEKTSEDEDSDQISDEEDECQKETLCLHCRAPCTSLCEHCAGAYFCVAPKSCGEIGWSHQCICSTWKLYVSRRDLLSTFPFSWHHELVTRPCQLSQSPYRSFLRKHNLNGKGWWRAELGGWASKVKKTILLEELSRCKTYEQGFQLHSSLCPPEHRVHQSHFDPEGGSVDERGLLQLKSWNDYYKLRGIPLHSPVALLLTFPLTLYHAIQKYAEVPITVSRMLHRPLVVHVVGIEKELSFLHLFRELSFLLPATFQIQLVFIIRSDMLPDNPSQSMPTTIQLAPNLSLHLVAGTYNDDLDPRFDCVAAPNLIVGLNAGLHAYPSWRHVIGFLRENSGVMAVFTDYNEHSAVHSAGVLGSAARDSLCVNPFRQPRSMPVTCMNLPQFSNGFLYVYNWLRVDE